MHPVQVTNVLIVGVGGQGVILASRLLCEAALESGLQVVATETHGMAQRGGSVDCHVRFGPEVHSPVIARGRADTVLAFELLEAVRYAPYLAPGGILLAAATRIEPAPVKDGLEPYPADLAEWIRARVPGGLVLDPASVPGYTSAARTLNVFMTGALSTRLAFPLATWETVLERLVKPQYLAMNREAFELGRKAASRAN